MPSVKLYVIDYQLRGASKQFVIRLENMSNAEAWHWASCDAGIGVIPRFAQQNIRKVSRPMAERYGLSDVRWRLSSSVSA
ncbi:hypothetical protein N5K35_13275 [Pseudomonas sp. GD03651]|uniref:DUF6555 family protein n=1 Tax=unclassified Pseudomonas TaxID=196821 RepID=UPI00244B5909|nr:DUF6555 family protein [Pseudomonas sp. GD03651]MDH2184679.1 hypothetical protein [Pseudomonas sp. GD03651]